MLGNTRPPGSMRADEFPGIPAPVSEMFMEDGWEGLGRQVGQLAHVKHSSRDVFAALVVKEIAGGVTPTRVDSFAKVSVMTAGIGVSCRSNNHGK